jgi:hypothetical protein
MSVFSWDADELYEITVGQCLCGICGAAVFNAKGRGWPRDEYITDCRGKLRRRFDWQGASPICTCTTCIFLADGDAPFAVPLFNTKEREKSEKSENHSDQSRDL